ncbi:MAG: DUF3006 domain-containing protein [Oscillospiraceae bacterium]|nr:DUF3006 domain-containing protein [Oscillospiraceae bacterium]
MRNIPLHELPDGAGEGDVLEMTEAGWELRPDTAALRRELLAKRRRKLLGGAP